MQKVKKYSRQILVFFMVIATALTCFLILAPKADAAANGQYYIKLVITDRTHGSWPSTQWKNCANGAGNIYIYTKANNGAGAEKSGTTWSCYCKAGEWDVKNGTFTYYNGSSQKNQDASINTPVNGFPYQIDASAIRNNNGTYRTHQTFHLYVSNNNSDWTEIFSYEEEVMEGKKYYFDDNKIVDSSKYPYATTATVTAGANEVKVNRNGTSVTSDYTASATDQYGVGFVNSAWSTSNASLTSNSVSGLVNTATFKNSTDAKDYSVTFTASFPSGNTSNTGKTASKTVTVRVPHTLTVDTNGGSSVNNITGYYTDESVTVTSPTKTAYDFAGWEKTSGEGTASTNGFTFGNGNATVKAKWTPHPYVINYAPDGGNVSVESQNYTTESTGLTLPTPTRDGYTFKGWVVSNAVGNWTLNEPVTSGALKGKYGNITAKATWEANNYTLTFDKNDADRIGSAVCDTANKTVTFDSAVGALPTASMNGYTFDGWFTAANGGTQVTAEAVYKTADNSTVYAHWTPIDYTVKFNTNDGEYLADYTYNIENGTLPSAVRAGYTFKDWTVTSASGNWANGAVISENADLGGKWGDVTLRAAWTVNNYEVTFDLNDGTRVGDAVLENRTMTATYDAVLGTLPEPTFTAYIFDGWFTEAEGGIKVTEDTLYKTAGNTTYYAHWTPIVYTAEFDPNNGAFDGMAINEKKSLNYTIENTFIFPEASRTGYTFEFWITALGTDSNWDADGTFDAGQTSDVHMYGNVTFAAKWDDNSYTLSFDLNDTDRLMTAECDTVNKIVNYDSAVGELPVPSMTAYTFDGWFTEAEGGEEYTAETVYKTAGNRTLYAHWTPIEYTVSYRVVGGTVSGDTVYTIEDELTLEVPDKTGFVFTQWIVTTTGGSWTNGQTFGVDALKAGKGNWGDVQMMAMFTDRYYKITWIINGVQSTSDVKYNTMPSHANPVINDDPRYEYTFLGWDPEIVPATADAVYVAQFTTTNKVYTLNWKDADGTILHTEKVAYDSNIVKQTPPTKDGYSSAWKNLPEKMPARDLDIVVEYVPLEYTITWANDDGTVLETDTALYNEIPSYDGAAPSKATDSKYSYTFIGWTPELSPIKGDTTFTAVYKNEPVTYNITWNLYNSDGSLNTTFRTTAPYGQAIADIPSIPKISGYAGEWKNIPETMPDSDITIRGDYVYGARTVTWVLDTDKSVETVVMDGNAPVYTMGTPQKNPTAEYSFTFKGWAPAPDGSVIANLPAVNGSDVTYYAVYDRTPVEYTVTWVADDTVVDTASVAYGAAIPTVTVPAKTGYTGAWNFTGTSMPARNITITAVYTPIKYTVTWNINGTVVDEQWDYGVTPVYSGVPVKEPTATKEFTFAGWDKEVVPVAGNTTYTAVFTDSPRKYAVTFWSDGETIATVNVECGAEIQLVELPEKEGYTGEWADVPETMPTENIIIKAKYTPKQYTITWVTPDGVFTTQADYDSIPSFGENDPTKASTAEKDFTFSGWYPALTPVKGNSTYTAQFSESKRKYNAVFMVNGVVYETRQIGFGDEITTPDVPEREGYIGKWSTPYRVMPAMDITLTASYTARTYTVLWKVDGLTVYSATVAYGQLIPEKDVPEKPGYIGAWDNDLIGMPARDLVINAVYSLETYNVRWNVGGDIGEDKASYGTDFQYLFISAELPDAIRVTVKGKPITNYNYNKSTGMLLIPGSAIVGDIYITESAAEGYNNVYITIGNGGSSNTAEVTKDGMAYHTQIYAPDGYLLPESVEIYLDGVLVTRGYTYDSDSGKLTINGEIMSGELEIKATCPVDPNYVPPTPDDGDEDDGHHGGLFGWLYDFFESLARFFRRIFGMAS